MSTPAQSLDHKAVIAGLSEQQRRQLTKKSDARGLLHLIIHWAAIAALSATIVHRIPYWPVLMIPLGILLVFTFTTLHETVHYTPFASRKLNQLAGIGCGLILFLPYLWFRFFHLAHHRHTQDPEKDPELADPKPSTLAAYLCHLTGLRVYYSAWATLLNNARGRCNDNFVPGNKHTAVRNESRLMLSFYLAVLILSILINSTTLLTIWIIPLLLGQPFLRLYLLAEHGGCPYVASTFENTRTTYTSTTIRLLAWNMPYHAEHHAYPSVPFFRLPDFHHHCKNSLSVTSNGYAEFHQRYVKTLGGTSS